MKPIFALSTLTAFVLSWNVLSLLSAAEQVTEATLYHEVPASGGTPNSPQGRDVGDGGVLDAYMTLFVDDGSSGHAYGYGVYETYFVTSSTIELVQEYDTGDWGYVPTKTDYLFFSCSGECFQIILNSYLTGNYFYQTTAIIEHVNNNNSTSAVNIHCCDLSNASYCTLINIGSDVDVESYAAIPYSECDLEHLCKITSNGIVLQYCYDLTDSLYASSNLLADTTYGSGVIPFTYDTTSNTFVQTALETGDLNGDENITVQDAYLCQKAFANASAEKDNGLSTIQEAIADVNGDNTINVQDAYVIQQYYAIIAVGNTISWTDLL
ncbi:MAG: dockerin type I repeat-containing protein [Ruminococcus sp.]|nr:dockerin type I repeat-containing protein [Ruminococcus sp.]